MADNTFVLEGVKDVNTRKETAEYFGVDPKTISREIQRGKLKCIHVGRSIRITRQQIAAYVVQQGGAS